MNPLVSTLPTLAVSAIYCLWHLCGRRQIERYRLRCERVAYMLWVMAQSIPEELAAEPAAKRRRRRRTDQVPTVSEPEPTTEA